MTEGVVTVTSGVERPLHKRGTGRCCRTNEGRAEMERLTERDDKGNLLFSGKQVYAGDFYEAASCLEEYEDTGLTPEEIQELKERDTAKPPIDSEENYGFFVCPSCGNSIYASDDFKSHKFCLNCGQRIRWED